MDDDLVRSIEFPSRDPNAPEVFYRVIAKNGNGPAVYVEDLLDKLHGDHGRIPLLLLWGAQDPWIRPQAADRIQRAFPAARRVDVQAGHCPHDEAPIQVNKAILDFMAEIHI